MKLLLNKDIKRLLIAIIVIFSAVFLAVEVLCKLFYGKFSLLFLFVFAFLLLAVLAACFLYFQKQARVLESAVRQIEAFLDGDTDARIDCNETGELFRLFHSVNTLASILNAHAENELREKRFLKNTISDISHQLKTPLAALNIYNGLLMDEAEAHSDIQSFAALSEKELDRIESLVQNLLKITKLDAGSIVLEKSEESVSEMMKDIELHFAYRTKQEGKKLLLSGPEDAILLCDRDWMMEAVSNIVKNAFDHTQEGDTVKIAWKQSASLVQIVVKDSGCGIHPEDLYHIFKRFYRSRFSKDTQGIGLGLPLAKSIIESHNGMIEVDSTPHQGTTFTINFLIPTKL